MNILTELYNNLFYLPTFNLLMFVYGIVRSFPVAIIVMTLIIRTLMIPLFMRQLKSQREMQIISPQVQEIQRQYKSDPMDANRRVQALYKEHHVNPLAGCLPTLVQLPFLWGLYGAFNSVLNQHAKLSQLLTQLNQNLYPFVRPLFGAHGLTTLPNFHFFGISLDRPDPTFILPVVAALLTFIQLRMSIKKMPPPKPGSPPDANASSMKMMQYMMPALTLFMGTRFQAGLALYWTFSTLFTVIQQYFVNGRNFGPLLDGIPGFTRKAEPAVALVESSAGMNRHAYRRSPRTVIDAVPPMRNGTKPTASLSLSSKMDDARDEEEISAPPKPREKVTSPPRSPSSRPASSSTKKDVVRLVPSANGNGSTSASTPLRVPPVNGSTAASVRTSKTPTRPITAGIKPKTSGTANGNRPSIPRTTSPARKKK